MAILTITVTVVKDYDYLMLWQVMIAKIFDHKLDKTQKKI
jgi:hypothetical protein